MPAATAPAHPNALLVPFSLGADLDSLDLRRRLSDGELRFVEHHVGKETEISEWRAADGPYGGTLLLIRPIESGDLGCAVITGSGRVQLAQALINLIPYVPADLLHLAVRTAATAEVRRVALRVLRMVYVGADGSLRWDSTLADTLAAALKDEDFEVRRLGIACELDGNANAGRRHLLDAIAATASIEERSTLEGLRDTFKNQLLRMTEDAPVATGRPLRFAFPIYPFLSMDELVAGHSAFSTVVRRESLSLGPSDGNDDVRELVELKLNDSDTHLTLVLDTASSPTSGAASSSQRTGRTSRIGGAYFSGPEAAELALGAAGALSYFPPELARHCAQESQFADFRARGVLALGMAEWPRIIPTTGLEEVDSTLLQAAAQDASPTVIGAAQRVQKWLAK